MRFPRTPRRLQWVFAARPLYFVTFCSYRKRPYLATSAVHNALETFAERAYAEHNVAVGRYVIMPDHVHLFACGDAEFDLTAWLRLFKPYLGKTVVRPASEDPIWQRGFFDHVLRSEESYAESGITSAKIPFALTWSRRPKIGRMQGRSSTSTACDGGNVDIGLWPTRGRRPIAAQRFPRVLQPHNRRNRCAGARGTFIGITHRDHPRSFP